MKEKISILGSTGSIGTQTLEVAKMHHIKVVALAAKQHIKLLAEQALEYKPEVVCIYNKEQYSELKRLLFGTGIEIVSGMEGLCKAATIDSAELVVNAVVGMIGLKPTLDAISAGKDIALANKETLVTGGELVIEKVRENGVNIYPIDSEHSAIFQCMQGNKGNPISKIILTASGGPFFGKTKEELKKVEVKDALAHPNWNMGKKITIDSSTLMNKGLELIEAARLFNHDPDKIEIVVQRESAIHSAVEYRDGSVIAQLGSPDMKIPIQYALTYPERLDCGAKKLSLFDYPTLSFNKPDYDTFDCLNACKIAIKKGGLYPTLVNGANEVAVDYFLNGKISFLNIGEVVKSILDVDISCDNVTFDDIIKADSMAREYVMKYFSTN